MNEKLKEQILLIDDNEKILQVKRDILQSVGFEVIANQYPRHAILYLTSHYPECPLTLVTDTDMPNITGPDLILYLSPKVNRDEEMIKRAMKRIYTSAFNQSERNNFSNLEGKFTGKLVLTSRHNLKPISVNNNDSDDYRLEIMAANEALRVADGIYKIDSYGKGVEDVVRLLRMTPEAETNIRLLEKAYEQLFCGDGEFVNAAFGKGDVRPFTEKIGLNLDQVMEDIALVCRSRDFSAGGHMDCTRINVLPHYVLGGNLIIDRDHFKGLKEILRVEYGDRREF